MEPEIEGGGSVWWWACPECRAYLPDYQEKCRSCGSKIDWGFLRNFYRAHNGIEGRSINPREASRKIC